MVEFVRKKTNMKKLIPMALMAFVLLAFSTSTYAQKKIKEGMVKFEMKVDGAEAAPEMAMMGNTTLNFYFTKNHQMMDMSMMAGMMRIQTFIPTEKPEDGTILMDMLGQKIQIIDMEKEQLSESNNFMNLDNLAKIEYDESDKKEIAGYKCYRATVTTNDGAEMKYYITEKITPPIGIDQKGKENLKGYPLLMEIDAGQGMVMVFEAIEVSDNVPDDTFSVPEGYEKMTMEEFEKSMGEMNMGF